MYIFIKYNYVINHPNDPFGARKTLMVGQKNDSLGK